MTLTTIHENAAAFQRRIQRRNLREYIAAVIVVLAFGWEAWIFPGWMIKAGCAATIAGTLLIVWQLHRRAAAASLPTNSALALVDFHRQELERQRNALRSVWLWYIAPVIPGVVLIILGRWFQFHAPGRGLAWDHQIIILCTVIVALVFALGWLLNLLVAERIQRKIDELDKLRGA